MGDPLDDRGLPGGRARTAERRALYERVLEPFLLPLIASDGEEEAVSAMQDKTFNSREYRRAVFEVTLYASDDVGRALGDMTNAAYDPSSNALVLWARLIRAVRKSVGNKGTQLRLADMLRPMIKDLDATPELLKVLDDAN